MGNENKRAYPRVDCELTIVIVRKTVPGFIHGATRNLGLGGAFVAVNPMTFGTDEVVLFRLSDSPSGYPCISGEARIRWQQAGDQHGVGLQFEPMSTPNQAILERFVAKAPKSQSDD